MKCNRKLLIAVSTLLLGLLFQSSVFALDEWQEYTEEGYPSGTWEAKTRVYWRSGDNWEGSARFCYFYNSSLPFTLWDFRVNGASESVWSEVRQYIQFEIHNPVNGTSVGLTIYYYKNSGGALSTFGSVVYVPKPDNLSDAESAYYAVQHFYAFRVLMYRRDNDTITVSFAVLANPDDKEAMETWQRNYTVGKNWIDNAKIMFHSVIVQRVWAKGYVEGQIWNERLICDGTTIADVSLESPVDFWENLRRSIWNSLTSTFYGLSESFKHAFGWTGDLYNWLTLCFTFVGGIVYNIVHLSLPFLPIILLFWFMDAMFTSVQEGKLQPIGNCFMTIYDFLRGVIQTIVNIASAIWEYIKFWG